MECLFCSTEIDGIAAVCNGCAAGLLKDDWYVDSDDAEGAARLLKLTDVVAILDGNTYKLSLDGADMKEWMGYFPEGEAGYSFLCILFNGLMEELGQPLDDIDFIPPPFDLVRDAIRQLETYEASFEGSGSEETYRRLSLLYSSASSHFSLPYVPDEFIRKKTSGLEERSAFWRRKWRQEQGRQAIPESYSAGGESEGEQAQAQPPSQYAAPGQAAYVEGAAEAEARRQMIEPKLDMLRKRITEMGEQMRSTGSQFSPMAGTRAGGRGESEPLFIRNTRKRAYLHYLAYSFETALTEIMQIIKEGVGNQHDYSLASVLALRTGKYSLLDTLDRSALSNSIALDNGLFRAVIDWKEGRWGRALQMADKEMKRGSYAAGFLLKKSIYEQYNVQERSDEIEHEGKEIQDLAEGADKLSAIYLSIGAWGAALQAMGVCAESEWTAETWTNMGMALEEKGDLKEAMQSYEEALSMNSLLLPAIIRTGLLHCRMGRHAQALEMLQRARQLEPPVLRLQAAELVELGRKEEAMNLLEKMLRQDEDDGEAATLGIRLSRELGKEDMQRMFRIYTHRKGGE